MRHPVVDSSATWLFRCADVPGTDVQLPKLNVEDTDREDGARDVSEHGSRRPSRQTIDTIDETINNVAEIATVAVQQLEPEVHDAQLAEVKSFSIAVVLLNLSTEDNSFALLLRTSGCFRVSRVQLPFLVLFR